MTTAWSAEDLTRIGRADELQIGTRRADGSMRSWVPIWAVCVGEQVFVRTWNRRDTGWFGRVVNLRRARIRVPGLEVDVSARDIGGEHNTELRAGVDAAYRAKYARYGSATVDRMTTDAAAATTLQLSPEAGPRVERTGSTLGQ